LGLSKVTIVKNVWYKYVVMVMQWCGSILCQVHSDVYAVRSAVHTAYTSLWT